MPQYQIRATDTTTGRTHTITTESKQNAIKYAASFQASGEWRDCVVSVEGKEYSGSEIRSQMP